MTDNGKTRGALVDSILVGAATSTLGWFIFGGLHNPLVFAAVGIYSGAAWWFRYDYLHRPALALMSFIPVALVLAAFLVAPSYMWGLLGSAPVVVLTAALLSIVAVRLAWADVPSTGPLAGIGPASAWAIVAAIVAVMLVMLAVLLAAMNG